MLRKKLYMPIGVCLVLLLAIGFLALRSDVPDEPVKIYKATPPAETSETPAATQKTATSETSQGGHIHVDGTWHAEPHSQVSEIISEADRDDDAAFEAEMAAYDAEYEDLVTEQEKLKARLKQLKAEVASNKELDEMNAWLSENESNWSAFASDLAPLMSLSVDEFHKRYPNLEENLYFVNRLLDLNDFRKEYVERTEGVSELTRQRIYGEMESQGVLDLYRNAYLKEPEYIPFLQEFIVKYAPIDGGHTE